MARAPTGAIGVWPQQGRPIEPGQEQVLVWTRSGAFRSGPSGVPVHRSRTEGGPSADASQSPGGLPNTPVFDWSRAHHPRKQRLDLVSEDLQSFYRPVRAASFEWRERARRRYEIPSLMPSRGPDRPVRADSANGTPRYPVSPHLRARQRATRRWFISVFPFWKLHQGGRGCYCSAIR